MRIITIAFLIIAFFDMWGPLAKLIIIAIVVSHFIPKKEIKRVETTEEKQG